MRLGAHESADARPIAQRGSCAPICLQRTRSRTASRLLDDDGARSRWVSQPRALVQARGAAAPWPISKESERCIASRGLVTIPVEDLDGTNAEEFKHDIAPVLATHSNLVLDLSPLRFVDSAGLGSLISCLRKLNATGGDLKLSGMSTAVRAVVELVRMHRVFDILPTKEDAVRAFESAAVAACDHS
jgi:anti-sigma B factor antagonist